MLTIHVEENRRHSGWNQGISGQMGSELSTEASYERRSRRERGREGKRKRKTERGRKREIMPEFQRMCLWWCLRMGVNIRTWNNGSDREH